MTISVSCRCGTLLHGSGDMAGVEAQCPLCRRMLLFPGPREHAAGDQADTPRLRLQAAVTQC
jgi:hypothetical protein